MPRGTQPVKLQPQAWYNLSGWIKGEQLKNVSGSTTANLSIMDTWASSGPLSGTFDWTQTFVTFQAKESGEVRVGCRLGHWGSGAIGKAYFDGLAITRLRRREGLKHYLVVEEEDIVSSGISTKELGQWQHNLDAAYDAYADLVGGVPFEGQRIGIVSVRQYPGGWAVAGNPIQWHRPYVRRTFEAIRQEGDWSFGILHELGHDFDLKYRWVWDAEFMANFKMEYVVEKLDAVVRAGESFRRGKELSGYFCREYDQHRRDNQFHMGVLHLRLAELRNDHGWGPFKVTFRKFNAMPKDELPHEEAPEIPSFYRNPQYELWRERSVAF